MSVTAVPIRPLPKGSVLKLWIGLLSLGLVGAGLAWFATAGDLQRDVFQSGLGFRVVAEGTGAPMTSNDLAALRLQIRVGGPEGRLIEDTDRLGQPYVTGTQANLPGLPEVLPRMRETGRYQLWVPPRLHATAGLPPNAPFRATDTLFYQVEVLQIERNMAALQSLFGPGGGAGPPRPPSPEGAAEPGGAPPPADGPAGNRQ